MFRTFIISFSLAFFCLPIGAQEKPIEKPIEKPVEKPAERRPGPAIDKPGNTDKPNQEKLDKNKGPQKADDSKTVRRPEPIPLPTDIRAKNIKILNLEKGHRKIIFDGDAYVKDADIDLNAGKIFLFLDKDGEPTAVECFNEESKQIVLIYQGDKAIGQKAVYNAKENTIEITGKPELHRKDGSRLLNAERIIVDRDPKAKEAFDAIAPKGERLQIILPKTQIDNFQKKEKEKEKAKEKEKEKADKDGKKGKASDKEGTKASDKEGTKTKESAKTTDKEAVKPADKGGIKE